MQGYAQAGLLRRADAARRTAIDYRGRPARQRQAACSRSNSPMTALARSRMACFVASLITPAEDIVASTICRSRVTSFFDSGRTRAVKSLRCNGASAADGRPAVTGVTA